MLDPTLSDWLDQHAEALDRGDADPAALLPRLAAAGVLGVAVEERSAAAAARSPTRWSGSLRWRRVR
ncbi:Acyl-CoA dehydrogenase, short-chain specific [Pseudomonas paraeruginosa]|nr:Acyl-CoA dehydrogenase, short-chain specific [Pseudomonas aeruginosa]